ncbi:MAG: tetraacyldisaccharide 4'-kinase [Gammaproteobacteria bacterium]|nr:MAG: tetraacyldisaccharide 4'-kinase [Gammaproteobacteria bacterium]TND06844.1 MAG: tetraacyldisaccharide 4'-kinase [Gammaproteobacteria bacterium]
MKRLDVSWYDGSGWTVFLSPLSWLFRLVTAARRHAYHAGLLKAYRLPVPVIVVGNITTGGTGKTPLVIWLAQFLKEKGFRPGIVCRGYRGQATAWPQVVNEGSESRWVGDEAVLLARRTGCTVVAAPDRVTAAQTALDAGCNVIVSDDGLQHYAMARDIEIVVIDGERRFGNGRLLPAGPLREPVSRLMSVDFVVTNGAARDREYPMTVVGEKFRRLGADAAFQRAEYFQGRDLHAVAGTGNPGRFFRYLTSMGLTFVAHPFPDHHCFSAAELRFGRNAVVLMTEKDAVKFPRDLDGEYWYLPVDAQPDPIFVRELSQRLASLGKQD